VPHFRERELKKSGVTRSTRGHEGADHAHAERTVGVNARRPQTAALTIRPVAATNQPPRRAASAIAQQREDGCLRCPIIIQDHDRTEETRRRLAAQSVRERKGSA